MIVKTADEMSISSQVAALRRAEGQVQKLDHALEALESEVPDQ
jgi:hypothetical protein